MMVIENSAGKREKRQIDVKHRRYCYLETCIKLLVNEPMVMIPILEQVRKCHFSIWS